MLTLSETKISTQYHQLQPGSHLAVLVGMSKALLALDDEANAAGTGRVIDVDFIEQDTSGFEAFVASMDHFQWPEIEACSGLDSPPSNRRRVSMATPGPLSSAMAWA